MLCGHKNTCLINGAAEGVSLLEHHVASEPYDLSAVVTCLHVGHTLFQETLRGVGCSEKTYPTGPRAVQGTDGDDDDDDDDDDNDVSSHETADDGDNYKNNNNNNNNTKADIYWLTFVISLNVQKHE